MLFCDKRVLCSSSRSTNKRLDDDFVTAAAATAAVAVALDFFVRINENGVADSKPRLSKCSLKVNDDVDELVFVVLSDTEDEVSLVLEVTEELVDNAEHPDEEREEVVEEFDDEEEVENFFDFLSFLLLQLASVFVFSNCFLLDNW